MRNPEIEAHIRDIPDFPKPGIIFKDITPILSEPEVFRSVIDGLAARVEDLRPDVIVGIESRGFLFGAPLALRLNKPFAPIRKVGKLPHTTIREDYELEYGAAAVEIHADALQPGQRVVVVDDLLATGGTMSAGIALLRKVGAMVPAAAALIELTFLRGRARLDVPCEALVAYDK